MHRDAARCRGERPSDAGQPPQFRNGLGAPECRPKTPSIIQAASIMMDADFLPPVADVTGATWPLLPIVRGHVVWVQDSWAMGALGPAVSAPSRVEVRLLVAKQRSTGL